MTPKIVGVIFSRLDLQRALRMRKPPDLFELRLDGLAAANVDMLSLVLIGSSQTRLIPGEPPRVYTPRGYFRDGPE